MDAIRFIAVTKAWIAEASRRRALAGVLGGALGALGLADAEDVAAAKSGKCKQKCGQCNFCKKGKCKNKDGKKQCKKGTCKPLERGTSCTGDNDNCACVPAIEGDGFCADNALVQCMKGLCANSGECNPGRRCARCGTSGFTGCFPECGVL